MIDLKFGKYGIKTADKLNIVLYELVENKKEDSKNFGEIREKVLGYYSELEHALNAYVRLSYMSDETSTKDLNEVKVLLNDIKKQIHIECERFINNDN